LLILYIDAFAPSGVEFLSSLDCFWGIAMSITAFRFGWNR
jgi:hypothetical protein